MSLAAQGISTGKTCARGAAWIWVMLVVCMIAVVATFMVPGLTHKRNCRAHELVRAINNMKQIGLGLIIFHTDYGGFPNDSTIRLVKDRFPETRIPMGTSSSNDYFHQLFAAQIVDDDRYFHGYGVSDYRPGEWLEGELPLPPGTCGFAYIIHDAEGLSGNTPLVVYPLVRGKLIFDKKLCKLWGNQAVVLYTDMSVQQHPIDSNGRMILDGRDFFDPAQPHWNGNSFRVVWPE